MYICHSHDLQMYTTLTYWHQQINAGNTNTYNLYVLFSKYKNEYSVFYALTVGIVVDKGRVSHEVVLHMHRH